jgi:sterol 3beta-glucosyltransferase
VPKNVSMINEIIHSCWGACIYPDPRDPAARPFIADAIISNPVTYGHVHCAEALGVPLHLMFPQVCRL